MKVIAATLLRAHQPDELTFGIRLESTARLGGFHLSSANFQLSNPDQQIEHLAARVMETVHVARIDDAYSGSTDARYAGSLKKGAAEEKVLIRVQVDEDTGSGTIQLRCDDPMVAASLIDVLKKAMPV